MSVDIHNLIAAINPDVYCHPSVRDKVKKVVKEKGYLAAAGATKLVDIEPLNSDVLSGLDLYEKFGLKASTERHKLVKDSMTEGLEPLYFWILDYIDGMFGGGIEKLADNFLSAPGSGHFSELMGKATRMQEESMKMLGAANQVVKSILNIVYDLKEFKLRLQIYDDFISKDPSKRMNAMLSLKQIWLDNVDIKRGGTSIKQLALGGQSYFVALIDAFMAAENEKLEYRGEVIDLNDRAKRILMQRVSEFFRWIKESELELRKRFEIEKKYLKSQVNTVKLYARWIKPYLKAAKNLEQRANENAGLINTFSSVLLELAIMGKIKYNVQSQVSMNMLPRSFLKAKIRQFYSLIIVDFKFRSSPYRVGQQYTFGGQAEIGFTSYSLNDDELIVLKRELDKDDYGDVISLIEGSTTESLEIIKKDIDEFLGELEEGEEEEEKQGTNPFMALFSFGGGKIKKVDLKKEGLVKSDNEYEKIVRSEAALEARDNCFSVYDKFKKAFGMAAHTDPYDTVF